MGWENISVQHDAPYLTQATAKAGKAIQKRIDALLEDRNALDNANPLMGGTRNKTCELLRKELEIRKDIAAWLDIAEKDLVKDTSNATKQWHDLEKAVLKQLIAIGYTEDCLKGSDTIRRHPQVRELVFRSRIVPSLAQHKGENADSIRQIHSILVGVVGRL